MLKDLKENLVTNTLRCQNPKTLKQKSPLWIFHKESNPPKKSFFCTRCQSTIKSSVWVLWFHNSLNQNENENSSLIFHDIQGASIFLLSIIAFYLGRKFKRMLWTNWLMNHKFNFLDPDLQSKLAWNYEFSLTVIASKWVLLGSV